MKINTNEPQKPKGLEQATKAIAEGFDPILDELKSLVDEYFKNKEMPTMESTVAVQEKIVNAFINRATDVISDKVSVDTLIYFVAQQSGLDCAKHFLNRMAMIRIGEVLRGKTEDADRD